MKEKGGNIVISRVLCGGAADRSGMLHPGDVLHEINGRSLAGLSVDDVADLMVRNTLMHTTHTSSITKRQTCLLHHRET